jgi:NRPS condensation-like uncharacterized protein
LFAICYSLIADRLFSYSPKNQFRDRSIMQLELQGFRLSPQQEYLWSLQKDADYSYCARCAISITGNLDTPTLKSALEKVVDRYEILRTTFQRLPGMTIPLQVITDRQFTWEERNARELENESDADFPQKRTAKWEALLQIETGVNTESEVRSPLAISLVTHAADRHTLFISLPALCADAATLKNLAQEIGRSYVACLQGREIEDEPLQYADLAQWQHQLIEEADAKEKNWELAELSALARSLKLPTQQNTRQTSQFEPRTYAVPLNPELAATRYCNGRRVFSALENADLEADRSPRNSCQYSLRRSAV